MLDRRPRDNRRCDIHQGAQLLVTARDAGLNFPMARRPFDHLRGGFAGIAAVCFPSTFLRSLTNMKDTKFVFAATLFFWRLTTAGDHAGWWPVDVCSGNVGIARPPGPFCCKVEHECSENERSPG